jgi:serine/threonine protein kinase
VKTLREEVYGKRFNIAVKEEAEALEMLNASRNPHLVKTIAYFTQANVHSFIFPWAERGNLQQFWDDDDPPIKQRLQQGYLKGVFTQLHGLLSGINFLHGSGTRHTDLKPGNILCFAGTGSENNFGTLVITDVGIAKFHNIATAARVGPTDNRTVTAMYAAPESRPGTKIPTSRRYDIWSLGCIYLEFVVWLLGGTEELRRFRKGLFNRRTNEQSFYTTETPQGKESVAKVGQKVIDWMVALRNRCPDNTALHKLVDLIEDEMLVANVVVRSIPVYPIGPGAVRSAATFGLPETPNLSPKSTSNLQVPSATRRSSRNTIGASLANILRRPSRKSTQNDARPGLSGESKMPDRAYAIELLPKLQSILEDERAFKMPLFTAPFRGPSSFGQTLGEPSWIPADGNPNSSPGVGYPS